MVAGSQLAIIIPAVAGGIAAVGAAAALLSWHEGEKCEKPPYTVEKVIVKKSGSGPRLHDYNEIEVRRYEPYIVAHYAMEDVEDMKEASSKGFRAIARYIFGANKKRGAEERSQKVSMTAPVQMTMPESIATSEPVAPAKSYKDAVEAGKSSYTMSFVMPSKFTLETLPIPEDEHIELKEVAGHDMVVYTFYGGSPSKAKVDELAAKLRATAGDAGLKVDGDVMLYQYHPPFAPWFLRKNEVLYRLQ